MPSIKQGSPNNGWDTSGYASGDDYPTKANYQHIALMNMIARLEEPLDGSHDYLAEDANVYKNGSHNWNGGQSRGSGNPFVDFFMQMWAAIVQFFRMMFPF